MGGGFQSVAVRELSKGMFPGSALYPERPAFGDQMQAQLFKKVL